MESHRQQDNNWVVVRTHETNDSGWIRGSSEIITDNLDEERAREVATLLQGNPNRPNEWDNAGDYLPTNVVSFAAMSLKQAIVLIKNANR